MNILIIQPKLEKTIDQLKAELEKNPSVDIVIFPEGYLNENVEEACALARKHNTILIGGYRRLKEHPKDRAIIINRQGEIILDRIKYSSTAFITEEGLKMGHILCDELIVQGIKVEQENLDREIDLIIHPIGVGMFSKAQFEEWITEAQKIAIAHKTMIIGTSHADGSYRNSSISIPIAYCIDSDGSTVFISENDVRTRIFNMNTKNILFTNT
ncbi:hypothetical protein KHA93_19535 [Bacillus sp. FJAT-49732]|uniref:CN hydrolase domain-containing protein n=1 Tax=Lederbergia citrisecunda TaxID=2833583 RepID=A0A942YNK2_9BACI|nr:hypothetical protein [Lederbergia citrisecunda]MBS4201800.1 hypothetical protein [Lederbergia citrisecunda]